MTDRAGTLMGHNEIRRMAGGCALLESWRSAGGGTGISINMYEPAGGTWNQVWVGSDGVVLRLTGGIRDGVMVLVGGERDTRRGRVADRISWTPLPDGRVEQRWDSSSDGGKTWRTGFLGLYRRSESAMMPGRD